MKKKERMVSGDGLFHKKFRNNLLIITKKKLHFRQTYNYKNTKFLKWGCIFIMKLPGDKEVNF
jgi:hypothetical protein